LKALLSYLAAFDGHSETHFVLSFKPADMGHSELAAGF
jgi:hypothetical protein